MKHLALKRSMWTGPLKGCRNPLPHRCSDCKMCAVARVIIWRKTKRADSSPEVDRPAPDC